MRSHKLNNRLFQMMIHAVLIVFSLLALIPFVLLITSSLTAEEILLVDGYSFFPRKWSINAYAFIFITNGLSVLRAYGVTVFITVVGTSLSLLISPMLAYVISRQDYKYRKIVTFIIFFTIIFNGGFVSTYIMYTQLFRIRNTIFALLFPNLLFNGFFVMIMKSYFTINIHPALIEAAKIDGAGEFRIYYSIVVPLSLPIVAAIGLMIGIRYWNDWQNGLYYITNPRLFSLQNLLNRILMNARALSTISDSSSMHIEMPSIGVRMAMAVIGVLPVMALYPFFQRYFIKGISLGGVKG